MFTEAEAEAARRLREPQRTLNRWPEDDDAREGRTAR
jgi:hypothetical protein